MTFGGIAVILSEAFKQTIPIVIRSHQLTQIRVYITQNLLYGISSRITHFFLQLTLG